MKKMDETEVYRYSLSFAVGNREKDLWVNSYSANLTCAEFIRKTIAEDFDGMRLNDDCLQTILDAYGFDRVMWVLANTVGEGNADGRYSQSNKEWAKTFRIPPDSHNSEFCVPSHPAIVNGLVDAVRKAWDDLHLWKPEQMESHLGQNLIGRVLVVDPSVLKDPYKTSDNQLFLAQNGNGCYPRALGTKVFGTFLNDGERSFLYRTDFAGILKDEYIPDWAKQAIRDAQEEQETEQEESQEQDSGMQMQ